MRYGNGERGRGEIRALSEPEGVRIIEKDLYL
jgi:hypothetical protein